MDGTCEDHCQRLENLLRKSAQQLQDKDKRCLQQLLLCVQQLDLDAMAEQDSWQSATKSESRPRHSRMVATVQPYSNSATPSTPTTPSKQQSQRPGSNISSNAWLNCSLSESGVFVECDTTETETYREPHPHLQYYQERLNQLEGKLLVYESSGETQSKHLAERLQRELQLNKQVKELIERVELLVEQNAQLDEAKCEFEEAENDTRLRLQRNEEELEILRQRNVELEFSKDALGGKYRDCRAECLILREDLCAAETQLEHLQAERQRAKQQLESLRQSLPLLLICRLLALARASNSCNMGNEQSSPRTTAGACPGQCNTPSNKARNNNNNTASSDPAAEREICYLKEEVKTLRCSLKELNARHYEAMESADSHWVDLEREYKQREEACRMKESCLKQKINKLQDCLRDDSRAATEKIQQLEETEHGLKTCLVRLTKEHRDLMEQNRALELEMENRAKSEHLAKDQLQPLSEELENEKRRSQALIDDLSFAKKLQQSTEEQLKAETDCLRHQIYEIKKVLMHTEVTNGELKEEVRTLEAKIAEMEQQLRACEERACCLEDELRTKDELCQKLERKLGVCPEGHSLADELYDTPEKRARRDEIQNLQAASQGLGCALRDLERRERELPTHKDFQTIACSVKQLADTILFAKNPPVSECDCEGATNCNLTNEERERDMGAKQEGEDKVEVEVEVELELEEAGNIKEAETPKEGEPPAEDGPSGSPRTSGGSVLGREPNLLVDESIDLMLIGKHVKQQICEMPTKLCRLVYGQKFEEAVMEIQPVLDEYLTDSQEADLRCKRRQCKSFVHRRLYRSRVRRSGASNRCNLYKLKCIKARASFHSAAIMNTALKDRSLFSSPSAHVLIIDEKWEKRQLNGMVQTEPIGSQCQLVQASPQTCDSQLQTQWATQECGIQTENVGVEMRLSLLPVRTRAFLELLQNCIVDVDDGTTNSCGVNVFRARVLQLWEGSEEFREHIELLQDLCTEDKLRPCESYDVFVAVLGCVRALKFALKPNNSELLQQLEERINVRLISFHNSKVESEFYCTIYYPVERRNTMKFDDTM